MLPASQIISQIRESASLKVEDLEKRINEFDVASASPGVRRAAGVLATPGLQRIKGATPEAAQLAAAALGVGYATGAGDTRTFRRNWHDTNQRSSGGDRSGAPVGLRGVVSSGRRKREVDPPAFLAPDRGRILKVGHLALRAG